jgi:APA family basic amino acid/polyamine antiporter
VTEQRSISGRTATLLVVASMVGTGVFTTTGHLLTDLRSPLAVLVCWGLGGVLALFGALAYGELAVRYPESGGETTLTTHLYGRRVGFVAGFVSVVVGFAAPIAASAIAFGEYADRALGGAGDAALPVGLALLVAMVALHASGRGGAFFQDSFTVLKVLLILAATGLGLAAGDGGRLGAAASEVPEALVSAPFALGLVYVSFAYAGWNAAVYVAGEVRDPARELPRALAIGSALVTILYLLLNAALLVAAPVEALAGETEVAHVAAAALFGEEAARVASAVIAVGLLSTVGAMVLTGARVAEAIGRRHPPLAFLARRDGATKSPRSATLVLGGLSAALALSASFEALLVYTGVTLSLFAALTVAGVFIVRRRAPEDPAARTNPLHPWSTLAFLALSVWMIVASILSRPLAAAAAAVTLFVATVLSFALSSDPQAL